MIRNVRDLMLRASSAVLLLMTGVALAEVSDGGGGGGRLSDAALAPEASSVAPATPPHAVQPWHMEPVRDVVARYHQAEAARLAGFDPCGACEAAGMYFIHEDVVEDASSSLEAPAVLRYEPRADGSTRLVSVAYVVRVEAWSSAGNAAPPALLGQEFVRDDAFLAEPVYVLTIPVQHFDPAGRFAF